jgi:hypothetical protein
MTNTPKNISASLENLAKLLKVQVIRGYRKKLATFLEVDPKLLSKYVERNNIPEKYLNISARKGFPPEKWIVSFDWATSMVESFAQKKPDSERWYEINKRVIRIIDESGLTLEEFYSKANINPREGRYNFPLGRSITGAPVIVQKIADAFGYSRTWIWHNLGNPRDNAYQQPPEHMLPPEDKGGEPRPGSWGAKVDLTNHRVIKVVEPDIKPTYEDIIKRFKDKAWALEVNNKLLELENLAPENRQLILGILIGIVEDRKSKKNQTMLFKIGCF